MAAAKKRRTPSARDRAEVKEAARQFRMAIREGRTVTREELLRLGRATTKTSNPVPSQEEVNRFVKNLEDTTLFASGAYGRLPRVKDWEAGKDFAVLGHDPKWPGGMYFSIRDVQTIYDLGYRRIVFGGSEGFDVELVMR